MGGKPILDRNGQPIDTGRMTTFQLPVCRDCNARLERTLESPAKDVLKAWFASQGRLRLSAEDARAAVRWLVKTMILEMHPRTRLDHPRLESEDADFRWPEPLPQFCYGWMIADVPLPDPPLDLSLWVYRRDLDDGDVVESRSGIPVPTVVEDGGRPIAFRCHQSTMHGLGFDLVYHPGWPILHPLEADGRAVRLWPVDAPQPLDVGALPVVPTSELVTWSRGARARLAPGLLGSGRLPPLTVGFPSFGRWPPQLRGWTGTGGRDA